MKIAFIGGGNMARAIIIGLQRQSGRAEDITVVELDADKRRALSEEFGVATSDQLPSAAAADVVVLAIKPQQMRDVAIFLGSLLNHQLVVSIAAGIRCADLIRWLGNYGAVVRVMPNTPAQVQAGVSALYAADKVSAAQQQQAESLMGAVGATLWLEREEQMDAVTAISGSGPAYAFYFMEAMQQAGTELGLAPGQCRALALQTMLGAAQLAAAGGEEFATLRTEVTSKGGTTERALASMEQDGVKAAIARAIHAAAARSRELGDQLGAQ